MLVLSDKATRSQQLTVNIGGRRSVAKVRATLAAIVLALGVVLVEPGIAFSNGVQIMGDQAKFLNSHFAMDMGGLGSGCTKKNWCFGPPVNNGDSGKTFEITEVQYALGEVTSYLQNFSRHTSYAVAERQVLSFLPTDVKLSPLYIQHSSTGSCAYLNLTSASLGKLFATPKIGDSSGSVGIDFASSNLSTLNYFYSPNNVQSAIVEIGNFTKSDGC